MKDSRATLQYFHQGPHESPYDVTTSFGLTSKIGAGISMEGTGATLR